MNKNIVAIIPARGGSKGILNKNIKNFCGKPLISWTIKQAKKSKSISSVWVSSDNEKILNISKQFGAKLIRRPKEISNDTASSESAWLHSIYEIEKEKKIDIVVAMQCTSPLREPKDIDNALELFIKEDYDSMFSGAELKDFYIWEKTKNKLNSINYDYKNRKRRQEIEKQFVENGSFYIFKPNILRKYNNRLGKKIGIAKMEFWKSFEIDELKDWKMCEILMKEFLNG